MTLQYAPAIVTGPTNETVTVGKPAKFTVTVMGVNVKTNHFVSQWYFDGAPIPKATNLILSLAVTSLTNSGSYSIIITNTYGSAASVPVTLTVVTKTALASGTSSTPTGGNYSFSEGADWWAGGSSSFSIVLPATDALFRRRRNLQRVVLSEQWCDPGQRRLFHREPWPVRRKAAFSANILLDGGSYALYTGQFDAAGNAYVSVPRDGNSSVAVFLNSEPGNVGRPDDRRAQGNADWTSEPASQPRCLRCHHQPRPHFLSGYQFTLMLASGTNSPSSEI